MVNFGDINGRGSCNKSPFSLRYFYIQFISSFQNVLQYGSWITGNLRFTFFTLKRYNIQPWSLVRSCFFIFIFIFCIFLNIVFGIWLMIRCYLAKISQLRCILQWFQYRNSYFEHPSVSENGARSATKMACCYKQNDRRVWIKTHNKIYQRYIFDFANRSIYTIKQIEWNGNVLFWIEFVNIFKHIFAAF